MKDPTRRLPQCSAASATPAVTLAALTLWLAFVASAVAGPQDLDWGPWRRMPVLDSGRMMPLDSFARNLVKKTCGTTDPHLSLAGALRPGQSAAMLPPGVKQIFPDALGRDFTAPELLFAWLAEPENWEYVPFLRADNEQLRKELLGLPLTDELGGRLRFVSPRQLQTARAFRERLMQIAEQQDAAQREGRRLEVTGLDKAVQGLFDAYSLYRRVTFNPAAPIDGRARFMERLSGSVRVWSAAEDGLLSFGGRGEKDAAADPMARAAESLRKLAAAIEAEGRQGQEPDLKDLDPLVADWAMTTAGAAARMADLAQRMTERPPTLSEAQLRRFRETLTSLATQAAEAARLAEQARLALYDNGDALRLVPALDPAALEADREPEDDAQPWLGFQAMIAGPDDLAKPYPATELKAVRQAWQQLVSVYRQRDDVGRPTDFRGAMDDFDAAIRALAAAIEPLRERLPIHNKDAELLAATAYPSAGRIEAEVFYNAADPFLWAWVFGAAASIALAVSFFVLRRSLFWSAIAALLVSCVFVVAGFLLRMFVTGWAPVTNMFETIVFVALCVAFLGMWITLRPLLRPGIADAWRWTAVPWARNGLDQSAVAADAVAEGEARAGEPIRASAAVKWLLSVPRVLLLVWIVGAMVQIPTDLGQGYRLITWLPSIDIGASVPSINSVILWALGLLVLGATVWYVSRAAIACAVWPITVPWAIRRLDRGAALQRVYSRRAVVLVGAILSCLGLILAYYVPVFHKEIEPLRAVLRNNLWLTIHVKTIVASFGAAAMAWGLGNIALGYYLFGPYHTAQNLNSTAKIDSPAPTCDMLAGLIYEIVQVAVLLLAVGTILGGMWADVSWGRFWGWDPKEVWALIALLIYMIMLHGRHFGFRGSFSMTAGAVIGFIAVVWAWYGVNFLMPGGKHSYGSGAGGKWIVVGLIVLNCAFLAAAGFRRLAARRQPVAAEEPK